MMTSISEAVACWKVRTSVKEAQNGPQPGAIIFASGTDIPEQLRPYVREVGTWHSVSSERAPMFTQAVKSAGRLFSFIAEPIEAAAIAFDSERALSAVLKKLFRTPAPEFNALEIARVSTRRFGSLVRVKITGYRQHLRRQVDLSFDQAKITAMGKRIEETARRFRHVHGPDTFRLADAPVSGLHRLLEAEA